MRALDIKEIFHKELDALYGKEEVESFFFICTEYYLNAPRIQFSLDPEFTLVKSEVDIFFKVLEDLKQQIPIQYIIGQTEFYGLKFKVDHNVLIPRQETEELVALIIAYSKTRKPNSEPLKILDIGTGSGCIAITLAKHIPNARVFALDISNDALSVARKNAELNTVTITYIEMDILNISSNPILEAASEFDIIVSNPPYVRDLEKIEIQPNVLNHEPHLALFVKDDNPLLFYKAVIDFAINNLKQKGRLYFEINQYLGEETKALLESSNFEDVALIKDLNMNDRIIKGIKKDE